MHNPLTQIFFSNKLQVLFPIDVISTCFKRLKFNIFLSTPHMMVNQRHGDFHHYQSDGELANPHV